jgi:hypothetical protein
MWSNARPAGNADPLAESVAAETMLGLLFGPGLGERPLTLHSFCSGTRRNV